ncbi:MAG: acetate kinase [Candidatus Omnitrophota bacterium]|nr:acetate kinase [Candidatus Omnitrophota bacterium]
MKILVINCGSSSIKYKLYEFPKKVLITKGLIEKIGENGSVINNHSLGVKELFSRLIKEKAIADVREISAIGHRVVHGGEAFKQPHVINNEVLAKIQECAQLAPLHNPANLAGIVGCREVLAKITQVAVFDTAFHQTILEEAYHYAIPNQYYEKYGIRRYGFHGTSHQFVAGQAAKLLKRPLNKLKLITCHLGNGCSITAINKGKVVDTSMGFTPLEGLIMGTRCGDIDVAAVFYIMEKEKLSITQMDEILNRKSGLLGVSKISNDIRDIKSEIKRGNRLAKLALEMFIYRIKKYIGAYYLVLGGIDAICFTAGIGENNPDIVGKLRKDIRKITSDRTKVLVVPTDEELMIATLTYDLLKRHPIKIRMS